MAVNIPPTSTKQTLLSPQLIEHNETKIYVVGNPDPCLGQPQKCGRVKVGNGLPTTTLKLEKYDFWRKIVFFPHEIPKQFSPLRWLDAIFLSAPP
jgi:hypothetical protein